MKQFTALNYLFPKINEVQLKQQRLEKEQNIANSVLLDLKYNKYSSSYNLQNGISARSNIFSPSKRNHSEFKKHKLKKVLFEEEHKSESRIQLHKIEMKRLINSMEGASIQNNQEGNHIAHNHYAQKQNRKNKPRILTKQNSLQLKDSIKSKILRVKTQIFQKIREKNKERQMKKTVTQLSSVLNVHRFRNLSQGQEYIRIINSPKVNNRLKDKKIKNNLFKCYLDRHGPFKQTYLKITSINGWKIEEQQD